MSGILQGLQSSIGGASIPALPDFTNVALCVGLNNWNPVGYPSGNGVNYGSDNDVSFVADAPYPLDWDHVSNDIVNYWYDQNGQANNIPQVSNQPTIDATNKWIAFDGMANGMQSSASLYESSQNAGTIYWPFKPGSLVETSVIFETGTGAADQPCRLSLRMVAGVLTWSVYDRTGVVCLPNTKIKTISDSNWHLAACSWDSSQSSAAQTALKVDNSTSGVTSPASAELPSSDDYGKAQISVGARDNGASAFFTGKMRLGYAKTVLDDATAQTAFYQRWLYLQSTLP